MTLDILIKKFISSAWQYQKKKLFYIESYSAVYKLKSSKCRSNFPGEKEFLKALKKKKEKPKKNTQH